MPDKRMNWTHTHAAFPCIGIEAWISEADPAKNETSTFVVRVTNNCVFAVGAVPPNSNTVNCVMGVGSNPDVFIFGGLVDIGILAPGVTKEATWIVSNTGPGAIDHPVFNIDITVSLWSLFPSTPPHNFPCP